MNDNNRLSPLAKAAPQIGITPRTWRNVLSRGRAHLPSRPLPPVVRVGSRLYVREADLTAFLASLDAPQPGDPADELRQAADQVEGIFPDVAERLRKLALLVAAPPPAGVRRGVCAQVRPGAQVQRKPVLRVVPARTDKPGDAGATKEGES